MLYSILQQNLTKEQKAYINFDSENTQRVINALNRCLINNTPTSSVYWFQQFPIETQRISQVLGQLNFIDSRVQKKFAQISVNTSKILEFVIANELTEYRINSKLDKYMPRLDNTFKASWYTRRSDGKLVNNHQIRVGFRDSAKCLFQYVTAMINKYYDAIVANTTKTIAKAVDKGTIKDEFFDDEANYEAIATQVIDNILYNEGVEYNNEYSLHEGRGRNVYGSLRRVFNMIGYKDARALLISSQPVTITPDSKQELDDIYYFVAELTGSKAKTEYFKIQDGIKAYRERHLPVLDLSSEEDRKDLHELIWLERIYQSLDTLYANGTIEWTVPLEIDASMSINQFVAALTGDIRLARRTNMLGFKLTDPWYIEGVKRLHGKLVGTPTLI